MDSLIKRSVIIFWRHAAIFNTISIAHNFRLDFNNVSSLDWEKKNIHLLELCKWFVQVCSKRKSPLSDVGDSKQKGSVWTFGRFRAAVIEDKKKKFCSFYADVKWQQHEAKFSTLCKQTPTVSSHFYFLHSHVRICALLLLFAANRRLISAFFPWLFCARVSALALEERMRAPLPPLMSKTEARSSHTGNNAAFFLPLAVFSLFFPFLLFMCQKIGIPVILKHSWTAPFFSSLDPWKDVINNKVPRERAMINFSFWLAMALNPPRCLRETAPASLLFHLLSFSDPSQHNRALRCLSVSAVMACVNALYMNKERVRVWFRFTRGPFLGSNPESAALQRLLNDRPNIWLRGVAENSGPGGVMQNIMWWCDLSWDAGSLKWIESWTWGWE